MQDRIRVKEVITLANDWSTLNKTIFEYQRADGSWETWSRETYDRGNGATILLYNRQKKTIILTRQFRYPAYVNGYPQGLMIETPAGLLDQDQPEVAIKRETEEETGYHIENVQKVMESYMSPGSVTERVYFFVAEYTPKDKLADGGGVHGEDIDTFEILLDDALAMIERGEILDGKTIMLLQYAKIKGLVD